MSRHLWKLRDSRGDTNRRRVSRRRLLDHVQRARRPAEELRPGMMTPLDYKAPLRFLETAFLPDEWIAVFLKSYESGRSTQRVGPVSVVASPRFQSWLRSQNVATFNVYVSVNVLAAGQRERT